jgi:hypothetical protein
MSKRLSTSGIPANAPVAKKSRIDIDGTATEVKTMNIQLIDALKAQKAAVQWGHTTCREDTMGSIAKAESMMSSVERLEKKSKEQVIVFTNAMEKKANSSCSASSAVEKLIDALIESEINTVIRTLDRHTAIYEDLDISEPGILEAMQPYTQSIKHIVKKQLKEKLEDLTVDDVIKTVKKETKGMYKAAALKEVAEVLEGVLG